jgi:Na+/H+ antiporter NhaA
MSIFTTSLAFNEESSRDIAKIAILAAMVVSVLVSWLNFIITERSIVKVAKVLRAPGSIQPETAIG